MSRQHETTGHKKQHGGQRCENIGKKRGNFQVYTGKPPSIPLSRQKILSGYTRQLSSVTAKNYKLLSSPIMDNKMKGVAIKDSRRVQSAKPKLYRSENAEKAIVKAKVTTKQRPASAFATSHIEPNVYGYESGKMLSGTSDKSNFSLEAVKSALTKEIESQDSFQTDPVERSKGKYEILMPSTLHHLKPWLTPTVHTDWTGMASSDCYMFLPSLSRLKSDNLPLVPHIVRDPCEELEFNDIIKPVEPWAPKKYEHPSWKKKRQQTEWKCDHGRQGHLRVYSSDGNLVHESHKGVRTMEIVRREIKELEDLMRGIGTLGSTSLVVQYQAEINELQEMINNTLGRVEEIERREREKEEKIKPRDITGLRAFYNKHDEVMEKIRRKHRECIRELARLEEELRLQEEYSHFRNRCQEKESKVTV